jgi:hypothetical protein
MGCLIQKFCKLSLLASLCPSVGPSKLLKLRFGYSRFLPSTVLSLALTFIDHGLHLRYLATRSTRSSSKSPFTSSFSSFLFFLFVSHSFYGHIICYLLHTQNTLFSSWIVAFNFHITIFRSRIFISSSCHCWG